MGILQLAVKLCIELLNQLNAVETNVIKDLPGISTRRTDTLHMFIIVDIR